MNFEIRFTPEAEETYDAVISQLRQRWGDHFVDKFEAKVWKAFETISDNPYIYPIARENPELRKCIPHKNCSMFYQVRTDYVLIAYFWDNRQDPLTTE